MKLIEELGNIKKPFNNAVITIGNFDGVHIGHQALFHTVIEKADSFNGISVAMTFEPHPIRVIKQNGYPPLITRYEQKIELIARSGIDVLICVPFSNTFAQIDAKQFVENILVKQIGMKAIVMGQDYAFGKNREGNLISLREDSLRLGFEVIVVDWIELSNDYTGRISSTKVRELVSSGRVEDAKKLLGRYYQIQGKVVKGKQRGGKLLGFPTANINIQDELCPKVGVYAVNVEYNNNKFKGVANIGFCPTFGDCNLFTVEVHILDLNKDLYDQQIRVDFIGRIRDEKKFSNISELVEQIQKDIKKADDILSK